jgi:coenzyme F420-reducing hydrogenase delta subunit
MNYTVQSRIREIIELLERIIYELERRKTKFHSNNSLSKKSKKIYQEVYDLKIQPAL